MEFLDPWGGEEEGLQKRSLYKSKCIDAIVMKLEG